MSELSARLGLYAAIDRAAAEDDGRLRLAGQVIPLYRRDVDADGDRRPANPDGTTGWAAHLDALLPGVEIPDLDQALAELADLAEVSELDQARRLKALWAAARVLPEVRNAGNLPSVAGLLRPLVQTARGDDSLVEDGPEHLSREVLDSDRFTTADPWADLTQVAVDRGLISARVAELVNVGCDAWVTLVPVKSATGVTIDPAARIISTITNFDLGAVTVATVKECVDPLNWPRCLPSFWCAMEPIAAPASAGPVRFVREVVGDCPQAWFNPYLRYAAKESPGEYVLQYDLAGPGNLALLSSVGVPPLVQDTRVEVDSGLIKISHRQRPGGPPGHLEADITTSKTIRFAEPLPTGAIALFACISGWADKTREMMTGCLGSAGSGLARGGGPDVKASPHDTDASAYESMTPEWEYSRVWCETMGRFIEGAVAKSVTADSLLQDLSLLAAAGARDAALAVSTCITAGQAIANLDLPHPDQAGKQ
ncbi:MAG: hypothetical protein WAX12_15355 [Candidatus Microthrix subdominans]|jgi:hypothetical protein|nr:hypothetical protein [Candidatus Microthrix sp.]MBK6309181.1 hypothetical protein [Candidatus Microthrix sp.]MBK6440232.1 hypothetical protein [Candidatus Microthrix sp.]MBK6970392.1 hypothetical protein [Candidatus Microthrix sp.]MBK7163865.1 hypothetical protein [Candidatus Microthrix sp.]MBP7594481.1 hypothetical protein [Candidatus Microthrix sp.]